jgi:GTP-binding protein
MARVDKHFAISGLTGDGCKPLTYAIMDHLEQHRREAHDVDAGDETEDSED